MIQKIKNLDRKYQYISASVFILLLAVVGTKLLFFSHASTVTTWPTSPQSIGANVCDNAGILTGPNTASAAQAMFPGYANVVTVSPGNIPNLRSSNTLYYFTPGTYTSLGVDTTGVSNTAYIGAGSSTLIDGAGSQFSWQQHGTNITIGYLRQINYNAPNNQGVMNHDAGHNWTITHVTAENNHGAAVFVGSGDKLLYNCLRNNGQYGFSAYEPAINGDSPIKDIVLDHNEISGNNTDDWETKQPGCGCTGGGKFWDVKGATVTNNWVHDNLSVGLWADTNNIDFLFENNYIDHNTGEGIWYEISYNTTIRYNYFGRNAWVKGSSNQGSPGPAIYLSESGGESRLQSSTSGSAMVDIHDNDFVDNMAGIQAYENVNRFCDSKGNTSSGYCTPFVLPTNFSEAPAGLPYNYTTPVNNTHPCYTQIASSTQLQKDCRWHAQNITVHNNEFHITPANIPGCSSIQYCGTMSLWSTGADNLPWALPFYAVSTVQNNVVNNQNNHWTNNKYFGPWKMLVGNSLPITISQWQAAPYNQDAGSSFQ